MRGCLCPPSTEHHHCRVRHKAVTPVTAGFARQDLLNAVNAARRILYQSIVICVLAWAWTASAEQKAGDKDCLACHADATLTKDLNGKSISLYVDEKKLKHSIHCSIYARVDCHSDVKATPHETPPKRLHVSNVMRMPKRRMRGA